MELLRGLIRLGAFSHGAAQRLDKTGGLHQIMGMSEYFCVDHSTLSIHVHVTINRVTNKTNKLLW